MASAAPALRHAAATCGRLVGRYSRLVANPSETIIATPLPPAPVVCIAWHEANLITVAAHQRTGRGGAIAFVPPGLRGAVMRGWLEELGAIPVALAADERRGLGLRQMKSALAAGHDVLIAIDGPEGPRHHVNPGAMWLARTTGAEIRPVGCAGWPCIALPRWDRLLVPLPGARTVLVMGAAWQAPGDRTAGAEQLAATLDDLTHAARASLHAGRALAPKEAAP